MKIYGRVQCLLLAATLASTDSFSVVPAGSRKTAPLQQRILRLSGGAADNSFSFEDTISSCRVIFPVGEDVHSKQVVFNVASNKLTLGVVDTPPAINEEELWGRVIADQCYWEIDDVGGSRCVVVELEKRDPGAWKYLLKSQFKPPDLTITDRCFLDIEIDGSAAGRVEVGLYGNQVHLEAPLTSLTLRREQSLSLAGTGAKNRCQLPRSVHWREGRGRGRCLSLLCQVQVSSNHPWLHAAGVCRFHPELSFLLRRSFPPKRLTLSALLVWGGE